MTKKQIVEKEISLDSAHVKHTIELVFGFWQTWFTAGKTKLLIARSLNEWIDTHPKNLALNGYLITDFSVFLIVKAPADLHELLASFYSIVLKILDRHYTMKLNFEDQAQHNTKMLYKSPFKKRKFFNQNLIRLLTGKKVHSTFFNPQLERLKDNIKHYNYCSAIDYSGAEGPVKVNLL